MGLYLRGETVNIKTTCFINQKTLLYVNLVLKNRIRLNRNCSFGTCAQLSVIF